MKTDRAVLSWRDAEAVRMRMEGRSYDEIAEALGYCNRSGPWKAVDRSLRRRIAEAVDEYRAISLIDLDAVYEQHFTAAMAGGGRAVDRLLRISRQRIALLGLAGHSQQPRAANVQRKEDRARKDWSRRSSASLRAQEEREQLRAPSEVGESTSVITERSTPTLPTERPQMVVRRVEEEWPHG